MSRTLTDARLSALRALVRAVALCVTAFGTDLSVDQVAAIQLAIEAVFVVAVQFSDDR